MRRVEARGAAYSAMRVKQTCGMVFRYAIATGHGERDPTPDLRGAIAPAVSKHYAAITDPAKLGELLRAVDDYREGKRVEIDPILMEGLDAI